MANEQLQNVQEEEKRGQEQKQGQAQDHSQDSEQRKPTNRRRKRTIRFVLLALVILAIVIGIPIYAYYSVRESTDDAQVDGHLVPISSRIGGQLLEVFVNDNQPVRAGQELVKLDPADYQVALQQAQAQLATSQANTSESQENVPITTINTTSQVSTATTQVEEAQAGVASAQQAVHAAQAKVNAANAALVQRQANYVKAEKDRQRLQELVQKDEISKQDFDAAVANAESNAAQVDSAKADIVTAQRNYDQAVAQLAEARARLATAEVQRRQSEQVRARQQAVAEARFKQAQAQVQQRQADIQQAQLNLQYTVVRAPVDGVVSRKTAEPGMQVAPGQQIMSLVPLDDVWVTANFKETQLKKMKVGQKVEIKADTYGGRMYLGHVDSIAAASGAKFSLLPPENATGNYVKVVQRIPVKIILEPGEDRDHSLLPGMSVTPTVLLNSGTNNAQ
jgi:membrane fusion protein (multidrug efflux system)